MIRYPRPSSNARPVARFAAERECATPGCITILSIYNAQGRCSLHLSAWPADSKPRNDSDAQSR